MSEMKLVHCTQYRDQKYALETRHRGDTLRVFLQIKAENKSRIQKKIDGLRYNTPPHSLLLFGMRKELLRLEHTAGTSWCRVQLNEIELTQKTQVISNVFGIQDYTNERNKHFMDFVELNLLYDDFQIKKILKPLDNHPSTDQ